MYIAFYENDYRDTFAGKGETVEKALTELKATMSNSGEDPPTLERIEFFMAEPVKIKTTTSVVLA